MQEVKDFKAPKHQYYIVVPGTDDGAGNPLFGAYDDWSDDVEVGLPAGCKVVEYSVSRRGMVNKDGKLVWGKK